MHLSNTSVAQANLLIQMTLQQAHNSLFKDDAVQSKHEEFNSQLLYQQQQTQQPQSTTLHKPAHAIQNLQGYANNLQEKSLNLLNNLLGLNSESLQQSFKENMANINNAMNNLSLSLSIPMSLHLMTLQQLIRFLQVKSGDKDMFKLENINKEQIIVFALFLFSHGLLLKDKSKRLKQKKLQDKQYKGKHTASDEESNEQFHYSMLQNMSPSSQELSLGI